MFRYFSDYYYTNLIHLIISGYVIFLGLKHFAHLRELKIFILYAFFSLLQSVMALMVVTFNPYNLYQTRLLEISINVFLVIEFLIFYPYIIKSVQGVSTKITLKIIFACFLVFVLLYWLFTKKLLNFPDVLTVIEAGVVIVGCLLFYRELFVYPPLRNIRFESRFWVITGMFFLFALFIPLFLFRKNLHTYFPAIYTNIYSLNFIAYTILFAFLSIGITCQIKAQK